MPSYAIHVHEDRNDLETLLAQKHRLKVAMSVQANKTGANPCSRTSTLCISLFPYLPTCTCAGLANMLSTGSLTSRLTGPGWKTSTEIGNHGGPGSLTLCTRLGAGIRLPRQETCGFMIRSKSPATIMVVFMLSWVCRDLSIAGKPLGFR